MKLKRKREGEEKEKEEREGEEEWCSRSKKTQRSPIKEEGRRGKRKGSERKRGE